jgi:hypothetical protein
MDEFRSITMPEWQEQAEAQSKHERVIGSGEGQFRQLLAKFGFRLLSSARCFWAFTARAWVPLAITIGWKARDFQTKSGC